MKKNTNIFEKDKNIDIFACFTRSFDKSHIENNKIHLISSVVQINTDEFKIGEFQILKNVASKLSGSNEILYYFYILPDNGNLDWLRESFPNVISVNGYYYLKSDGVFVFFASLDVLIGFFNINSGKSEIFDDIFGHKNLIKKDFEVISPNCLFHFRNLFWSNILLKFKMAGIHISGGSISKRHILKTIELQLINLLNLFYNSDSLLIKNIYSNLNNDVLSSSIPLDLYNKSLDITKELSFLKNIDVAEHKILADLKKLNSDFCDLIGHNYRLSVLNLTNNILGIYNSEIKKLKENLFNIKSDKSHLEFKIQKLEELPSLSLRHLKNKEKKKIKKQRTLMLNSKFDVDISDMNKKISRFLVQIEELESEISKKENELKNFNDTLINKNIIELNNLYESLTKNGLKIYKFTKRYKDLKNNNGINYNIRKFSTLLSYKDNIKEISIPSNSLIYNTKKMINIREYSTKNKNNKILSDSISLDISKESLIYDKFEQFSFFGFNKDKISNEISIYFKLIYNILQNDSINTIEKQIQIEKLWFNIMEEFYQKPENLLKKNSYFLIRKLKNAEISLKLMFEKGKLKQKFPFAYLYLNDFKLLMLTYMLIINSINKKIGYTATSRLVGSKIIQFLYYKLKKNSDSDSESDSYSKNEVEEIILSYEDFVKNLKICSNEDFIKLGDFFISILTTFPSDIFEREYSKYESFFNNVEVKLKYNINNYLEILDNLIIDPFSLPMICNPNLWSQDTYGGYLLNEDLKENLITGSSQHDHQISNKDILYKTVNYMSTIKFGINKEVLNYIINTDNESLKKELFKGVSSLQNIITYNIALIYINQPFYIPNSCDWRGRIYTKPFYITYQGNDFSLSLLEFWEGQELNEEGLKNLYIYGANVYNYNNIRKNSFEDRFQWVLENKENILKMENEFINGAQNKLVFIAFCLTMKALKINPKYLIKLPVFLDATCSGIQHLAALLRDDNLGFHVNLSKQNNVTKPEDLYTMFLKPINEEINRVGREDPKFSNLSFIELNRKIVKKPIMTKPYNATVLGMKDSLIETLEKQKINKETKYIVPTIEGNTTLLSSIEIMKIAMIIYNIIYSEFPSLKLIYDYFIDMAKILNKLNMPITWITPAGIKIIQKYNRSTQRKIAISLGGKSKKMVLREWGDEIDKNKQTSAIVPNIIHSLDASHIMQIININLNINNYPIITVHDCFGTHPNNLTNLSHVVKLEFINLYSQYQFLDEFHKININLIEKSGYIITEILDKKKNITKKVVLNGNTKLILPDIPITGNLNLNDIIYSKYFIN